MYRRGLFFFHLEEGYTTFHPSIGEVEFSSIEKRAYATFHPSIGGFRYCSQTCEW
jgi:hypothetical protein